MQIILPTKKYINAPNLDSNFNINLESTSRLLPYTDINDVVNQYEVFDEERGNSTKYRLILTINPFCTNILSNPLTIIPHLYPLRSNDDVNKYIAYLYSLAYYNNPNNFFNGKEAVFLKGYNIFDNFLFRSDLFKHTEELSSLTINGKNHVFDLDSTWSNPIAFNNGLKQDDKGWVGFYNPVKIKTDYTNKIPTFVDDVSPCSVIDLFPTREWFTFNGLYDKENFKMLNNWDYIITYPFENDYSHNLIKNGIPILSMKLVFEKGVKLLKIRTAYKNNLTIGDKFILNNADLNTMYTDKKYKEFTVYRLGKEDEENTFYISNYHTLLNGNDIFDFLNIKTNGNFVCWLKKITNGVPSSYYMRKFKKLVNLKYEQEEITPNNFSEKENDPTNKKYNFGNNLYGLSFAKTVYGDNITQVTFTDDIDVKYLKDNLGRTVSEFFVTIVKNTKNTIYKDRDGNDLRIFGDVSSGFDLTQMTDSDKTFSHSNFFNQNYSSIKYIHNVKGDDITYGTDPDVIPKLKEIKLTDLGIYNANPPNGTGQPINDKTDTILANNAVNPLIFTKSPEHLEYNIDIDKDWYYGDIIENNPTSFEEIVLEDVYHRFNTLQRESDKPVDRIAYFHEIISDDFDHSKNTNDEADDSFLKPYFSQDLREWNYSTKGADSCVGREESTLDKFIYRGKLPVGSRPEGYYYKPHYPIKLKLWSNNIQHRVYRQYNAVKFGIDRLSIGDGKFINYMYFILDFAHGMKYGDIIRVKYKDEANGLNYDKTSVVYMSDDDPYKLSIIFDDNLNNIFTNTNFNISYLKVSQYASDIPEYANDLGDGRYSWRTLLKDGDIEDVRNINNEHVFTNGCFYIHNQINFYLRRQDPFGDNGLLYKQHPADLAGEKYNMSNINYNITEIC